MVAPCTRVQALGLARAALCVLLLGAGRTRANMYDVFFPHYAPPASCTTGCSPWAAAGSDVAKWFAKPLPADADAQCAIPGRATGNSDHVQNAWGGPFCLCKPNASTPQQAVYCTAPDGVPEQINLVLAAHDTVVASWVTFGTPQAVATATLAEAGSTSTGMVLPGVTHHYREPVVTTGDKETGRNYSMSFVRFPALKPRQTYSYKVRSGGDWSATFSFRAPYSATEGGETRIAIFGDMAVTAYNNMGNLRADCAAGTVDAIVMMGDHAYNLGQVDDHRGDAYMNSWQPTLAQCPWVPVIGNHEAEDGDNFHRYDNMTWGETLGQGASSSTATSALGHLLTKGLYLAPAAHGSAPSGTSRYFSVDIGLIHVVGLDLTPNQLNDKQLEWLEQDLAAADSNRGQVPWVVVTSHYPIHLATDYSHRMAANASAKWWNSEKAEHMSGRQAGDNHLEWRTCDANQESPDCPTVADQLAKNASPLEPLFAKYGVDIYDAGHSHLYGVTWPMANSQKTQENYTNPRGTVYITEGNGGVPGSPATHQFSKPTTDWMRIRGHGSAYGRMITSNSSTLVYEHVWNNGNGNGTSQVMETWSIQQATHSFPPPPPPSPSPSPPPPPPMPAPKPTPAGHKWECHQNTTNAGLVSTAKLKDQDWTLSIQASTAEQTTQCEGICNALPGCVVFRVHFTDGHCHTMAGAVTHTQFSKSLKQTSPAYIACMLVADA